MIPFSFSTSTSRSPSWTFALSSDFLRSSYNIYLQSTDSITTSKQLIQLHLRLCQCNVFMKICAHIVKRVGLINGFIRIKRALLWLGASTTLRGG